MTGPQGAGTFAVKLGNQFTGESTEDFTTDAGTWDWNVLNSSWLGTDLGDANYTISAGKLVATNVNTQVLGDDVRVSAYKMWGSIENHEDLTTGGNRQFRVYINFSRWANTATNSAGYWVSFGRIGTRTYIAIGKTWNGVDTTYQIQYNPIPIGAVIRIRHDGLGLIIADIDEVDALSYIDTCFQRSRGGGMGWSVSAGSFTVDNLSYGIWGTVGIPVPWYQGDACDTNLIGSLWTASTPGSQPNYSTTVGLQPPNYRTGSGSSTTHTIRLADTSLLLGDCYMEATLAADTSVLDNYITLRGNHPLTQGYYFRWTADGTAGWQIGKHGVGQLAASAASSPGSPYRIRAEAIGNSLKLYQWSGGVWVLKVSTTDATYSAGIPSVALNDVFNQGIPIAADIVVGNIPTFVSCTVERRSYDVSYDSIAEFNIIFSDDVTGFTSGDIVLSGPAAAGTSILLTGSGRSYTAQVSGFTTEGLLQLDVPASCCTAVTHGAANDASTSFDNDVFVSPWEAPVSLGGNSAASGAGDPSTNTIDLTGLTIPDGALVLVMASCGLNSASAITCAATGITFDLIGTFNNTGPNPDRLTRLFRGVASGAGSTITATFPGNTAERMIAACYIPPPPPGASFGMNGVGAIGLSAFNNDNSFSITLAPEHQGHSVLGFAWMSDSGGVPITGTLATQVLDHSPGGNRYAVAIVKWSIGQTNPAMSAASGTGGQGIAIELLAGVM